jgi:integrase
MRKFERLTPQEMRQLKAGESIFEQGIMYSKLSNGDGSFAINIMVDGERIRRVLGKESEGVTRQKAEQFIESARTQARERRFNLPKGRKLAMGFQELAEKYLERMLELGGEDAKKKKYRLETHLIPFFGTKPFDAIVSFDIERYYKHRKASGAKASTINRECAVLSHMANRAKEWGWVSSRNFEIKKLPEEQTKIVYLTTEQCQRLLDVTRTQCHELHLFVRIGLATGMRRSNIFSIRLEDLDLAHKRIFLPKTKTGARSQPITTALADYLAWYLEQYCYDGQEWLFPSKQSPTGHRTENRDALRTAVLNAELDPDIITAHTMRHTVVSQLVQKGVDIHTIMDITGHKTQEMVQRYSHRDSKHIEAAMDKLEEATRLDNVIQFKEA